MTRVWHLTSAHVPFDTRIFHKEGRTLVEAGYDVTLVAPDAPRDVVEGVRFEPLPREHRRWRRFLLQPLRVCRAVRRGDPDICHFHDPDLLLVGLLLALSGRKVVYDSHENLPKLVAGRTWIPAPVRPMLAGLLGFVERMVARRFAAVISAEPAGAGRFGGREVHVVRNLPLRREWDELPVAARVPGRLVYVGDITVARGAMAMLDVLGHLSSSRDVSLLLGGKVGDEVLARMAAHPAWPLVDFRGWMDRDQVREALVSGDVGLVLLQPTSQYAEATQPVKLYEYLAAGLRTVASDFAGFRDAVEGVEGVRFADPTDLGAIAAIVEELMATSTAAVADEERDAARRHILENLTWEAEANVLLELYAELSQSDARSGVQAHL